jgi:hypothetical protein
MSSVFQKNIRVFKAGADLSTHQHKFVKHGATENEVILCTILGENCVGVLQTAPKLGEAAEVAMLGGGALLKVSGVTAAGDLLKVSAAALGVVTAVDGDNVFARALAAGVANDVIEVERIDRQA